MTPLRARLWHIPGLLKVLWAHKPADVWSDIAIMLRVTRSGWVRYVCDAKGIVGFILRDGASVHALYVDPRATGQGIGKLLVQDAKLHTRCLDLWVAQANPRARRFYTREGFAEKRRSPGTHHDIPQPDILMVWPPERRVEP